MMWGMLARTRCKPSQLSRTNCVCLRHYSHSSSATGKTAPSRQKPTTTNKPTIKATSTPTSSSPSARYSATVLCSQTTAPQATGSSPSAAALRRGPTMAEKEAEALRRLEERFGGAQEAQLGELDDHGRPRGMAKHVSGNLFRLI
ncbi:BQ2448_6166 [Microbotryum intermedium]|uniref:BQ2448_6166 protein n=1 Tax=Microbotryum intermedium TaxID=269621 RepID=A0A238FRK6_9BASI|nr:BQ2448_6166 [Microbotryum intermedium]